MGRKPLNTGQVSVPGSGDTIHDGGNKLRDNFTELYNAFGDQRLSGVVKSGSEEWIRPHATGYFQHKPLSFYASALTPGSMYDIDSTLSAGYFPVRLPVIGQQNGQAKRGERIVLQDTISSWGTVPVRVEASSGQSITGSSQDGYYRLNENRLRATFIVVNDELGSERWSVKVESVAGNEGADINTTQEIPYGGLARVDLHATSSYNTVKVLVYAESVNISDQQVAKRSCFEMHIMNAGGDILSTRYAVMNQNTSGPGGTLDPEDTIVDAAPTIYTSPTGIDIVAIDFTSTEPNTQKVYVTVKSTGSVAQKV